MKIFFLEVAWPNEVRAVRPWENPCPNNPCASEFRQTCSGRNVIQDFVVAQFSLQFRFPGWFWCSPGFIEWTMFFSAIRDPQWKPPSPSFRWSTCQPLDVVWPCPSPWPCCCLSDGAFLSSFLHLFNWTLLQNPVQVPSLDPWCLQLELLPSAPPCVSSLLLAHLFHQWVSEQTAAFASHQPVALGMAVGSCFSSPGASGYELRVGPGSWQSGNL